MRRNSVLVLVSVALGACACVLVAILAAGGSYVAFMTPGLATENSPVKLQLSLTAEELASLDEKAVGQAEQALIDWMRNTSGARTQLDSRANEVFRRVDEARATSIQKMMRQYMSQAQAKPLAKPAPLLYPLPPAPKEPPQFGQGESTAHVLAFLAGAPLMFADLPRGEQGNVVFPPAEFNSTESTPAGNVHTRYKFQTLKIVGSQVEVEIEITIRVEKDGFVYEEKVGGTSRVDLCPNAQGEVPLELTLRGSIAAGDAGTQFQFRSQATGHVDDEANLVSTDIQTQAEMARQPDSSGKAKGESNQYLEWNQRYTLQGLNGNNVSISGTEGKATRGSAKVDQKFANESNNFTTKLSSLGVLLALKFAEDKWKDGYCVQVLVPEMGSDLEKRVSAGSETPFTAVVRHKFEGKELAVPVISTLTSGGVSVRPAGSKVPAPATFQYKAPDKGGRTASIELQSRSRRGIGKLTLSFIRSVGWRVDQPFGEGVRLTGLICDRLDNPFMLEYAAPQFEMSGQYTFIPSSEDRGTFTHSGTAWGGMVTNSGAGSYKIDGANDGMPVIRINGENTQVTRGGGYIYRYTSTFDDTIELKPADDECS